MGGGGGKLRAFLGSIYRNDNKRPSMYDMAIINAKPFELGHKVREVGTYSETVEQNATCDVPGNKIID